jgi:hypothetical protein
MTSLMSILCLASYAQGKPSAPPIVKTTFGVKAGVNLSNIINGQENLDFSPGMKADFHLGVVANLHFGYRDEGSPVGTGRFGLQPELLYSRQGFAVDDEAITFDYITLPVMARLYATKDIYVEAGPYFGYLLQLSANSTVIEGAQIDLSSLKGGIDFGAGVGAGYESRLGLIAGIRYQLGLSDMAGNLKWKNNVVALSLGWLF